MGTSAVYTTFCDTCGEWSFGANTRHVARHILNNVGWLITDEMDLCPMCRARAEAK